MPLGQDFQIVAKRQRQQLARVCRDGPWRSGDAERTDRPVDIENIGLATGVGNRVGNGDGRAIALIDMERITMRCSSSGLDAGGPRHHARHGPNLRQRVGDRAGHRIVQFLVRATLAKGVGHNECAGVNADEVVR